MKTTFLILILILSLTICFSACKKAEGVHTANAESSADQTPPDGENIFFREDGSLEKIVNYENGTPVWIREYDENGNYIRYIEYTPYGHFAEDKISEDITDKITFYDTNGKITESVDYEYYENGILNKETVYSGTDDTKEVYFYDSDGINTKYHFYSPVNGSHVLVEIAEFEYYENGQSSKNTYYRGDGTLSQTQEFSESGYIYQNTYYDSKENIEKYTVYKYSETFEKTSETCYGAHGNILYSCLFREDGSKFKLINYSQSGNLSLVYEYGDTGNIKKIENYDENGLLTSYEEFDENGNKTRYTSYNDDRTFLVYDGNYNIIEGVCYTYHASGEFIKQEYLNGHVIYKAVYDKNAKLSSLVRFDGLGNTVEETNYSSDGEIKQRFVYLRYTNGEIINYTVYEAGGTNLVYSPDGSIISGVRCTYYKGALYKKDEYQNGIKRKETLYSEGKVSLISEYDENELLKKETFYSSGKLSRVREYDTNGVLRKDTIYNSRGKVSSVIKYDEKGNKI